jgi:hypothetical protein
MIDGDQNSYYYYWIKYKEDWWAKPIDPPKNDWERSQRLLEGRCEQCNLVYRHYLDCPNSNIKQDIEKLITALEKHKLNHKGK